MIKNEYQVGELVEVNIENEYDVDTYHAYIVERLDDESYNVLVSNSAVFRYDGRLNVKEENISYLRDHDGNKIYKRISEEEIEEAIEFIKTAIKANKELNEPHKRLEKYFKIFRDDYVEEE